MPMQTHERRQTSRGGLNGSDASGWSLQAVRDKARRRSVEVRDDRGDRLLLGYRHRRADERGGGARGRTQVALVGGTGMVVRGAAGVMTGSVVCSSLVLVFVVRAGRMVLMNPGHMSLSLHLSAWRRALHGERQRTPYGEQHGEQQKEPDAKGLHSC